MSYGQFMSYAASVKARGGTTGPNAAIKQVDILDIMNQIAAVKVVAWWGTDYLQLGKYDGQWMIAHVIWQSPPLNDEAMRGRPTQSGFSVSNVIVDR